MPTFLPSLLKLPNFLILVHHFFFDFWLFTMTILPTVYDFKSFGFYSLFFFKACIRARLVVERKVNKHLLPGVDDRVFYHSPSPAIVSASHKKAHKDRHSLGRWAVLVEVIEGRFLAVLYAVRGNLKRTGNRLCFPHGFSNTKDNAARHSSDASTYCTVCCRQPEFAAHKRGEEDHVGLS